VRKFSSCVRVGVGENLKSFSYKLMRIARQSMMFRGLRARF
jgi:hypothetical protein